MTWWKAPRAVVIAVTVLACILAPSLALAQQPAAPGEAVRKVSLNCELWLAAVRSHVPGQMDRAVLTGALWSRRRLEAVVAEAGSSAFVDGALLKRAAVLHADIAVLHRNEQGYSLPSDGRSAYFVEDGSLVGKRNGTFHWRVGRRILDLVAPDDDVRLWYVATSAFLQSWNEFSELEPHLGRARDRFPRDGLLLLYEGTLRAAYAEPRVQNLLQTEVPGTERRLRIGDAKEEQKEAERRFEKALELAPDLTEARIRLAHVRGLLGRHQEAAALLRRAVEQPLEGHMQYYAWLLLGREEEALGRPEAARAAFTRAMTLYPGAQSPRLGLSLLARAGGDRATARSALEPLSNSVRSGEDPWWSFHKRHSPDLDELFAQMWRRLAP